jgi:cytoskeletal protein CcmA (bactofilin family)
MLFKKSRSSRTKQAKGNGAAPRSNRMGPSIITGDVVIEGSIVTGGELQIDGTINGDIRARAVVIDVQGVVHGRIVSEDVFVRGRVIGPINALNVTIVSGGHVEGDVVNETIAIENGAHVDGKIQRSEDPLSEHSSGFGSNAPMLFNDDNEIQTGNFNDDSYRPLELIAPRRGGNSGD